jgi:hypothetical protein
MKSIIVLLFVFFIININKGISQVNSSDSSKLNDLLIKMDGLNAKFDKVLNAKDNEKQKLKYEKQLEEKTKEISKLAKKIDEITLKSKTEHTSDSLNKIEISSLKSLRQANEISISNLQIKNKELEDSKISAENYKESKEKQLEEIKRKLKATIENSKKIDANYVITIKMLLFNETDSKDLLNQLTEFMDNQKKMIEIDSIMRLKTFADFKITREKIDLLKINQNFKGQVLYHSNIKMNLDNMITLIDKYKKWHEELNIEKDDLKFTFKFQDKVIKDRNIPSINDLFINYPCINYCIDRILENRKTYTLPSTN